MVELFANSGDPDQMSCSMMSDLGLHSLPVTRLGVSSPQWVIVHIIVHNGLVTILGCSIRNECLAYW